ncbi:MAG: precorrin-3B C(17)-methyltransferase [Desulfobacterales bacterium]|nr:MAG: precorrin-3B C(17)-methyltransferase [Desulfobacterales bacterium]
MRSSGNTGSAKRKPGGSQADKSQCNPSDRSKILHILGVGPGDPRHLTRRAVEVLSEVNTVVGYTTYIDLIRPLIDNKQIISSGMTKEVERVESAINVALNGQSCAIVSSGDPGIYAMAGLVFDTCSAKRLHIAPLSDLGVRRQKQGDILYVEIIPGIPALCAGAALLGAPLSHDFAVVSLSDLLTPWEIIEKRLVAAARADFAIVLYNPKSKKRTWQLEKAQQIILKYRDKHTPVGIVVRAMRKRQHVEIISLENLHNADVNMQTTVFVGSSTSRRYLDFMYTPRGYSGKYKIG